MVATDNGKPENFNTTTTLTVSVFSPDNFFSPVLDRDNYDVTVNENTPAGEIAFRFTMTDGDQVGPAAQLNRVILTGSDTEFFKAEITGPNSGVVRTT